jgi:putative PEP-CTERM system TPR-repeat lipoprotein
MPDKSAARKSIQIVLDASRILRSHLKGDFMTTTASPRSVVLALAITLPLAGCWEKDPESHIQEAKQAIQKSDYKAAIIGLKSALQSASGNAEARLLLGQTFQSVEQWENSEKELRKAQELGMPAERVLPLLAKALLAMGKNEEVVDLTIPAFVLTADALASLHAAKASALMALNKMAEAEAAIEEGVKGLALIDQSAFSNDMQLAKARLALRKNQPSQAESLLDVALQRDPKFIPALFLRAQLQLAERKTQEALKTYEQIIAAKPNEVLAHLGIVELKLQNNDLVAAEKTLLAAEKIDANSLQIKYNRAKLYMLKGDLKTSNEVVQQVLRALPNHLPALMLDAVVSFGLGNYEQSSRSAQKVLGRAPGHPYATKLVAANELRRGNAKVVLELLQPLSQRYPEDGEMLSMLAEAYLQSKHYDKSMATFERAAALQPGNPTIKKGLARGYYAQGKIDLAMHELEQAASLSDKGGQVDLTLIALHMSRKEYDQAMQVIAALERKFPNNPVTSNLQGTALLGKNDRLGARKAFERALAKRPDFFPAAANLARMDMADNQPDTARERFKSIVRADADNLSAMMALAELAKADKAEKDMLGWLEKASKADPKAIAPRNKLVHYYLSKKLPQQALTISRETVSSNPDSPEALSMLGSAQMAAGDKVGALSSFAKITVKAPNSAESFFRLGVAQVAVARADEGRASFEKALSLDPGHAEALNGLLMLDAVDKKLDRALQRARAFQAKNPKSPVGFVREGDILSGQQLYAQAAKAFERGLSLVDDLKVFSKMQNALVRSGNQIHADRKMAALLSRFPKSIPVQSYAADYYLNVGRNADSLRLYEDLLQTQPENANLLNNLALLYQRMNDGRALLLAERALKLAPDNPGIMDTLGWLLLDQGQTGRALELLRQATAKAPKLATVRYHLAVALEKAGNKSEAKRELTTLLEAGSGFPELDAARKLAASL